MIGRLELLGIAVGLSMDALAVAVATSVLLRRVDGHQLFRLSFHFGLFQALMPVIGWALGSLAADHIRDYDHWIAFFLLAYVGGRALREALSESRFVAHVMTPLVLTAHAGGRSRV